MCTARALVTSMRPRQWTKNAFVLAALVYSGDLLDAQRVLLAAAAFALFCLLSGSVYLVNDIADAEADRAHETKRDRPIAARDVSAATAAVAAAAVGLVALAGSFALSLRFGAVALAYALLQVAYTLYLKKMVILDVMAISAGFALRAAAGAFAIGVPTSSWLLLCTFLLALFLALSKRRHELVVLGNGKDSRRATLQEYTAPFIDSMLTPTVAATILAYAMYTFTPTAGEHYRYLMGTVPLVVFGLFRYLYLVHRRDLGGSPEDIVLSDVPLIVDILSWAILTGVIVYVLG